MIGMPKGAEQKGGVSKYTHKQNKSVTAQPKKRLIVLVVILIVK